MDEAEEGDHKSLEPKQKWRTLCGPSRTNGKPDAYK